MYDADYYRSERFIHDSLLERAEEIAGQVRQEWRKNRKVETLAVAWPSENIKTDDGGEVSHAIMMPIPDTFTDAETSAALHRLVERTKAYGIVLVEQRTEQLRILFETHHGARAWLIPLERHGDLCVPGETVVHDNTECLGLLWQPRRGAS